MARLHGAPPNARGCKTWIQPRKIMNRELASDPGIQAELSAMAESLAFQARNHLASHTDEGKARILTEKHGLNRYIILEDLDRDADALAIEYGHWTRDARKGVSHKRFVEGLNILGGLVVKSANRPRGAGRGRIL